MIPTEAQTNRIFFLDNPWPAGHRIDGLTWEACYEPDSGFWFNLSLTSEDYYAEDPESLPEAQSENTELGAWYDRDAWSNFHSCCIDGWGYEKSGFLAFEDSQKFDLAALENKTFCVDPLPRDILADNNAFHIYLVGHDSIAAHRIRFGSMQENGGFSLNWSGKIALTYYENEEYKYTFQANYDCVKIDKIYLPAKNENEALQILHQKFKRPEKFEIIKVKLRPRYLWHYAAILNLKNGEQ